MRLKIPTKRRPQGASRADCQAMAEAHACQLPAKRRSDQPNATIRATITVDLTQTRSWRLRKGPEMGAKEEARISRSGLSVHQPRFVSCSSFMAEILRHV